MSAIVATGNDFADSSSQCTNGDCTRPKYRITSECFHCWLGTKWDSMKQRTDNKRNYYPGWSGLPLKFTRKEFVAWGLKNPPPENMDQPSVDRIEDLLGYVPGNIQWLSRNENSRKGALKQHANYRASR